MVFLGADVQSVQVVLEALDKFTREINRKRFQATHRQDHSKNRTDSWAAKSLICRPRDEGGLGLRKLEQWNKAAIMGFIWSLFAQAGEECRSDCPPKIGCCSNVLIWILSVILLEENMENFNELVLIIALGSELSKGKKRPAMMPGPRNPRKISLPFHQLKS
uniref:Uncharacterized protein n=1 Tax=Quercus lobata TaxID=97700 RepID=A0A7N2LQ80_QUELO